MCSCECWLVLHNSLNIQFHFHLRIQRYNSKWSKGQRSRSQCIDYRKWFMSHNFFPLYTYHHETSHTDSQCVKNVPYQFQGQKVKVTALITENGNWHIIAFPVHIQSWNFVHRLHISQGYARKSVNSWLKNLESLNWLPQGVFVPLGQPHSSLSLLIKDQTWNLITTRQL